MEVFTSDEELEARQFRRKALTLLSPRFLHVFKGYVGLFSHADRMPFDHAMTFWHLGSWQNCVGSGA
jgi:hypothetical protein